ncbi:MAG: hypothetical protein KDK30_13635 [Leptospiraceae bacterium]|nr:hypothetical protein [Leptospiraceae bacterium]
MLSFTALNACAESKGQEADSTDSRSNAVDETLLTTGLWQVPGNLKIQSDTLATESAMRRLFGSYNPAEKASFWAVDREAELAEIYAAEEFPFELRTEMIKADVSRANAVVFVFATKPEKIFFDCRICAPDISVAVFRKEAGPAWRLDLYQRIDPMGHYGTPPETDFIDIGPNHRAISFASGDLHMGFNTSWSGWFARVGDTYKLVFSATTYFDNEGTCEVPETGNAPCVEYSTEIEIVETDAEYYEIHTTTTGRDITPENEVLDAASEKLWRFNGEEYAVFEERKPD